MPLYAQVADLVDRFGQAELVELTDRTSPVPTVLDTAVAERALADADAQIDGYLGARYQLPLPSVSPLLVRIACDIARYLLWEDRASDEVRERYRDAVRMLEALAKGIVTLGLSPVSTPSTSAGPSWSAPDRITSVDMEGP